MCLMCPQVYKDTSTVPHLVHCLHSPELTDNGNYCVELQPLGYAKQPQNEADLKCAMSHVLLALSELHRRGYVHRDVRWANILQDGQARNATKMFLRPFQFA